jgi:hypothetical protein
MIDILKACYFILGGKINILIFCMTASVIAFLTWSAVIFIFPDRLYKFNYWPVLIEYILGILRIPINLPLFSIVIFIY